MHRGRGVSGDAACRHPFPSPGKRHRDLYVCVCVFAREMVWARVTSIRYRSRNTLRARHFKGTGALWYRAASQILLTTSGITTAMLTRRRRSLAYQYQTPTKAQDIKPLFSPSPRPRYPSSSPFSHRRASIRSRNAIILSHPFAAFIPLRGKSFWGDFSCSPARTGYVCDDGAYRRRRVSARKR